MSTPEKRRKFLKTLAAIPAFTAGALSGRPADISGQVLKSGGHSLKISLNAYSFNEPLSKGTMNLDDLLEFCSDQRFDAVDLTGYYFPGYPAVPTDEYLYHIKRKAFRLGLDISGTGVRNDFAEPDESKRKKDVDLVKDWIGCAAKMGAPVIRIFAGKQIPEGYSWEQVFGWMMKDIGECIEHGKKHGVIVAIQNHDDFVKTAGQVKKMIDAAQSEWFGLVLDIGSYRTNDPYTEIESTASYAVNWQIKEKIFVNGREEKPDLARIISIVKKSGYRGYLPIETLGPGDPKRKVPEFLAQVRKAMG
ncbi:sugar phosphate isomerase/epimerase [Rhodocytophaga rosea]|uniref:Sugar phosphate isomerase/epimerase n=1 Tax=Rhodocytophaga rosea TaxID=2704465 RepID=A0A6C0GCJ6_9BACT|nr:sugar phosphate isomerase/epimerase family protein [Rhodocytophaga rosea]QHT65709.1 sugar phosphate isomerase/epimerase [Rhodocytophaga rosea]